MGVVDSVADTALTQPLKRFGATATGLSAPTTRCHIALCDALRCAKNGDPNQAALVSEMLKSGYGCNKDADEARYWKQVARNAGARRIEGVYDELP